MAGRVESILSALVFALSILAVMGQESKWFLLWNLWKSAYFLDEYDWKKYGKTKVGVAVGHRFTE